MVNIKARIGKVLYRTEIKTDTQTLISDEPVSAGGTDSGFAPDELLAAALGACTCITLRMYANRKGWDELAEVKAEVTFSRDPETRTSQMIRTVELIGMLTEEQRNRLLAIANKCPVHNTLSHTLSIETTLK